MYLFVIFLGYGYFPVMRNDGYFNHKNKSVSIEESPYYNIERCIL